MEFKKIFTVNFFCLRLTDAIPDTQSSSIDHSSGFFFCFSKDTIYDWSWPTRSPNIQNMIEPLIRTWSKIKTYTYNYKNGPSLILQGSGTCSILKKSAHGNTVQGCGQLLHMLTISLFYGHLYWASVLNQGNFEYYLAGCAILEYSAAFWVWRS